MKNSHIKIWIRNRRLASVEYPLKGFVEAGYNYLEGKAGEPPAEGSYSLVAKIATLGHLRREPFSLALRSLP
jgi:hypothetical protein